MEDKEIVEKVIEKAIKGGNKRPDLSLYNKLHPRKGRKNSAYIDGRCCKKYYCKDCGNEISISSGAYGKGRCASCSNSKKNKGRKFTKEHKEKIRKKNKGKKMSLSSRKKMSKTRLKLFKNKIFKNNAIRHLLQTKRNKINKSEKYLRSILYQILPREYKFVGNGKLILDGLCPDFVNINGQKKIIELYGDYWHNLSGCKERDKRRPKIYKRYGYKTLIIWQHELKDIINLKKKIKGFHYDCNNS